MGNSTGPAERPLAINLIYNILPIKPVRGASPMLAPRQWPRRWAKYLNYHFLRMPLRCFRKGSYGFGAGRLVFGPASWLAQPVVAGRGQERRQPVLTT